jgi:hypothetical protein
MSTVAVVGINGQLGKSVLAALTGSIFSCNFNLPIRAITRNISAVKQKLDGVSYFQASDEPSYEQALMGVDTVIDLRGVDGLAGQDLIEAAANCRVKLYIPSEFCADYALSGNYSPYFRAKADASTRARSKGLKVVEIKTGYWIDVVVNLAPSLLFLDPVNAVSDAPSVETPISVTSVKDIGLSIASVVSRDPAQLPDVIRISSDNICLDDVVSVYEKASGRNVRQRRMTVEQVINSANEAIAGRGCRIGRHLDIIRAVSVCTAASDFMTQNHNDFVNPGLFAWDSFESHGMKAWTTRSPNIANHL